MKKEIIGRVLGFVLAAACLATLIYTRGGAVPIMVALLGAFACVTLVGNPRLPLVHRIALGVAMVVMCWGVVLVMFGAISLFSD